MYHGDKYGEQRGRGLNWPIINDKMVIVKSSISSFRTNEYKYKIERNFTSQEGFEAARFAEDNFKGDWLIGINCSGFEFEEDAMIFKLRWI